MVRFFFVIFLLTSTFSFAQETKKIELLHADTISINEFILPNIQILRGCVELRHDQALMMCDSAYFNSRENSFRAFGNIFIVKPSESDTVRSWSDSINYDGRKKLGKMRGQVKMVKDSLTLLTQFLDYDMKKDIGYYYDGGRTENGKDTLTSRLGHYYTKKNEIHFTHNVVIKNPKYTIFSDTIKYQTVKKISYFVGPTRIISDSNLIYSENGWYDHNKDISQFNKKPYLVSKQYRLQGDSLYYDRKKQYGKGYKNVVITDTIQNIVLKGNYGFYNEKTEEALLTDSAMFIQAGKDRDSLFMHADTIKSVIDTLDKATAKEKFKLIRAYHHMKLFKSDIQAACDSMSYSTRDSIVKMYRDPVLWSNKDQLTADFITIKMVKNEVDKIYMNNNAMIVEQSDTFNFNQIKGNFMTGYIKNKKLHKIDVNEESKLIYFVTDNNVLIGINQTTCKDMIINLIDGKVDNIWFYSDNKGKTDPPGSVPPNELLLQGFRWLDKYRPKTKYDIFKRKLPKKGEKDEITLLFDKRTKELESKQKANDKKGTKPPKKSNADE